MNVVKFIILLCIYIICITKYSKAYFVTIGAIVSNDEMGIHFLTSISNLANKTTLNQNISYNGKYIISNQNPIYLSRQFCSSLILHQPHVIIINGNTVVSDLPTMAISFTCGYYHIPVIGISNREAIFSDKNAHPYFVRNIAMYSEQAEVWLNMLQYFEFKKIIFVYSYNSDGRAIYNRFQNYKEMDNNRIEKIVSFSENKRSYIKELEPLITLSSKIIILYSNKLDAETIFKDAEYLNLTVSGYVWFVSDQALKASNVPKGILGTQLIDATDEASHIEDAVNLAASTIDKLAITDAVALKPPPSSCGNGSKWQLGSKLLKLLCKNELIHGKTGHLKYDENCQRMNSLYDIVNVQNRGKVVVGSYSANSGVSKKDEISKLTINDNIIVWPGQEHKKPKGFKISSKLKVVTIEAVPFIYKKPAVNGKCDTSANKLYCPKKNSTSGLIEIFCCHGYAMDLLVMLSQNVNFTFQLELQEHNQFGESKKINGSTIWSGMIGDIQNGNADMIVAPLTISPERADVIDFSKPFKYQGLTILVKKTSKDSSLGSFLQPFQQTLWLLVGLSVHIVALVLYLLDRFSPFGRFKMAKTDVTEEDALNLSSAMWFAWGVLLNSGIGEGTPRSFSARVLGMVWAGFAMIIVASYTANLAAFLVLDRPEASISGIDDTRLRNPQENFKYATVKDSAVSMYFKRQVELSTMYRTMEGRNYDTAEEAIRDVTDGKLQAFIWDSSRLEYEAANDCKLVTAGELFGRSGYGIGLHKGSPWTQDISLTILSFHESGAMENLDRKWILIKDTKCPEKDSSPATLGLTNMAGVFMMVGGGIVAGVFIICIEIAFKRQRRLKKKRYELTKTAVERWRGNVEKRKAARLLANQKMIEIENCEMHPITNNTTEETPFNNINA